MSHVPKKTSDLRIRPATRTDVPLILTLIRELAEYERLAHAVVATHATLESSLFPRDGAPAAGALIGESDGSPAGYAIYFTNFSTFLGRAGIYLEDLYVRPSARGKGLGKALLTHVARIGIERGCQRMEWAVLDWNQSAIAFYKSLGADLLTDWRIFRLTGQSLQNLGSTR